MVVRLVAIALIYIVTSVAWLVLGATVFVRSDNQSSSLKREVSQIWGSVQTQKAPSASYKQLRKIQSKRTENNKTIVETKDIWDTYNVPLVSSRVDVGFDLDHRQKGLLWYSTYKVGFHGVYIVKNETGSEHLYTFNYVFPTGSAVYDDFHLVQGGVEASVVAVEGGAVGRGFTLRPGETTTVDVTYNTQGLDEWWYDFGEGVTQVRDFKLTMATDFDRIDFPAAGISATNKAKTADGWKLDWTYKNLLTAVKIGLEMPKKLNPGPWVGQVTLSAPISLGLFFFLLFVITSLRGIRLHPMHYFFMASGFFAFHLLLAYLVDHLSVELALGIASLVSVALVVSYMRLVVNAKFAFVEVALAQLVYLVLFSCTFFLEGYTGLAITILCIATLFVVMQATARIDWEQLFSEHLPAKAAKPKEPSA